MNGTALLKFLPGWACCGFALMGLRGGPYIAGMVLVRSKAFLVGRAATKSPSSKACSQQVGAVSKIGAAGRFRRQGRHSSGHAEVQVEHSGLGLDAMLISFSKSQSPQAPWQKPSWPPMVPTLQPVQQHDVLLSEVTTHGGPSLRAGLNQDKLCWPKPLCFELGVFQGRRGGRTSLSWWPLSM